MEYSLGIWSKLPDGYFADVPLFAIGDTHGCFTQLVTMQESLAKHIDQAYPSQTAKVIYLGDYCDRGPDTLGCLNALINGGTGIKGRPSLLDQEQIFLYGNHDSYLYDFINGSTGNNFFPKETDETFFERWMRLGGHETLWSIVGEYDENDPALAQKVKSGLGSKLWSFLRQMEPLYRHGNFVFVHAGLNPDKKIAEQSIADLVWIRDPFLKCENWPFDEIVVHGHTVQTPAFHGHRFGVDGGCVFQGTLTALELFEDCYRFHHVTLG